MSISCVEIVNVNGLRYEMHLFKYENDVEYIETFVTVTQIVTVRTCYYFVQLYCFCMLLTELNVKKNISFLVYAENTLFYKNCT